MAKIVIYNFMDVPYYAEAVKPRKTPTVAQTVRTDTGFNEAEAVKPRKTQPDWLNRVLLNKLQ